MSQTKPDVPALNTLPSAYKESCKALGFCVDEFRRICGDTNPEFTKEERNARMLEVKRIMNECANDIINALANDGLNNVQRIEAIEYTPFPVV